METLTSMPDFDQLYQSLYPATTLHVVSSTVPATTAPGSTVKGGLTGTEIILGIACVLVVGFGCYYIYKLHEQERSKQIF
ncbi:hypothetical protein [Lacibacter sediminis]|uniref:Uncharacterized protein n=1 Tax=Lacibacter sediminis TaxID=2760713 RepID=A0A7G5XK47_9BACT|nr:hypothetical protein [Lacibacter sediminis]QNA45850.1 hypothetical protein H4075_06560 [Lacibacter sediminis]